MNMNNPEEVIVDKPEKVKNNILIVDDHPFIIQGYKNAITRYKPESFEFLISQANDCVD